MEDAGKAFFGVCLGHQLLAMALGGEVGMAERHELGFPEVALLDFANGHPVFTGLSQSRRWLDLPGNVNWRQVATISADKDGCQDRGLDPSTRYLYRVAAYNRGGRSKFSGTASVQTFRLAGNYPF